jgi:hypothetical protein
MDKIKGLFVVVVCFCEDDDDMSVMGPYRYEEAVEVMHKEVECSGALPEYIKIAKLTFLD